ncbi:hypothetical protein [Amycolatopsis australiensis]|uniref:hypothetical protein n=1 Tax=Amycolatopsis australiensis TaxID=546364 RepID=UPI00116148F6|nr:hypothetical protein [Amycolatopsis australiensis]
MGRCQHRVETVLAAGAVFFAAQRVSQPGGHDPVELGVPLGGVMGGFAGGQQATESVAVGPMQDEPFPRFGGFARQAGRVRALDPADRLVDPLREPLVQLRRGFSVVCRRRRWCRMRSSSSTRATRE